MNLAILGEENIAKFGEYDALIFEGRSYTNVELQGKGGRFATALVEIGINPGDRVGVMMPNVPEVGAVYGAISRCGAVTVPMLFLLAPPEITHILADCEAKAMITSPEFYPNVALAIAGLQNPPAVIVVGEFVPEEALSFDTLLGGAPDPLPIVDRDDDDVVVISYTSGTTGRPKGVMLTHGNMTFQGRNTAGVVDIKEGDRSIGCLPLAHLFGFGSAVLANLFKTTGVLLRWFTPEAFFDAVNAQKGNTSGVVPTMLTIMLSHPGFDDVDWSSLRWVVCGAAPLPVELAEEFEKRTGARVLEGYGLTETSPAVSLMRATEPRRPGSCGRPVPHVEVRILDDDNNDVPTGRPGEVCVRGPNIMKGYYKMPEATAEAIVDDWFHTGDLGHLDEDGYLYITERKKDLIIRAGFNIFPRDVEEVLYGHPAVQEAAVVGIPDSRLGEQIVAYVTPRPGMSVTADELMAHCRDSLAKYKTPKEVRFIDLMPKNAIGKILKKDLRAMAVS